MRAVAALAVSGLGALCRQTGASFFIKRTNRRFDSCGSSSCAFLPGNQRALPVGGARDRSGLVPKEESCRIGPCGQIAVDRAEVFQLRFGAGVDGIPDRGAKGEVP